MTQLVRESTAHGEVVRAAMYVRMSKDSQYYSIENQSDAILRYAMAKGYEVVRTYTDRSRSGLTLRGRDGLKSLLADVAAGRADYGVVLVYDVSRWGRFQDPDEAAAHELTCKRAGVQVHYCAEQFTNDGSLTSSIYKTLKRAMAGEYSRELSFKVHAAQLRLAKLGYWQGGRPPYGLRRMLMDEHGRALRVLGHGEYKCVGSDHVVLVPGPAHERVVVREIFSLFVGGYPRTEIARRLRARGVKIPTGGVWDRSRIQSMLVNEKYVGEQVWNRNSGRLQRERASNSPAEWVRAEGVFEAIVDPAVFERAQVRIMKDKTSPTDEALLADLSRLLDKHGFLSRVLLDTDRNLYSAFLYRERFGNLRRAYALVGYEPEVSLSYLDVARRMEERRPEMAAEIAETLRALGSEVSPPDRSGVLVVDGRRVAVEVANQRAKQPGKSTLWSFKPTVEGRRDLTVIVRFVQFDGPPADYLVLPEHTRGDDWLTRVRRGHRSYRGYLVGKLGKVDARPDDGGAGTSAPPSRQVDDRAP